MSIITIYYFSTLALLIQIHSTSPIALEQGFCCVIMGSNHSSNCLEHDYLYPIMLLVFYTIADGS